MMKLKVVTLALALLNPRGAIGVTFTPLDEKPGLIDTGKSGQEVEVVHLFKGQAPVGITVHKNGRAFVNFPRCVNLLQK